MTKSNIVVVDYEATCAAGTGIQALRDAIRSQHSGLKQNDIAHSDLPTWIGKVEDVDQVTWETADSTWQSRNNALIKVGLDQGHFKTAVERLKNQCEPHKIGIVMGSSTSSIDRAEQAYRELHEDSLPSQFNQEYVLNPHAPGLFVAEYLGLKGPSITINTACSSSAKVFATAARWLDLGIVDAAIVGGADTLCLSVLHGFHSLQLVSENPCKPFDQNRDGINLGEAAAFAILTRADLADGQAKAVLSGYGESSDAHHMSHPHPEGLGARAAIEQALAGADLLPKHIDYINLHGTASRANDKIEGNLVGSMFPDTTMASSTKGWMGHTLGAAGIMEAIVALDALTSGIIPGTLNLEQTDADIALQLHANNQTREVSHVMSNSFGFGGNNCCLIFSRA